MYRLVCIGMHWYDEGYGRKQSCAYLHKDTYDLRRRYHSGSRSKGNHRSLNRSVLRERSKVKKQINIEKKEIPAVQVAEEVAEKEAAPEEEEITAKVIATDTEEKAMEAERRTGGGVKAGAT